VRHHPLRAVLHQQDHAVAVLHALLAQVRGQPLGLIEELAVGEHLVKEHQRGFVRVAQRAHREVVPQRSGRRRDPVRQALGPEAVVRRGQARFGRVAVAHALVSVVLWARHRIRVSSFEQKHNLSPERPPAQALQWTRNLAYPKPRVVYVQPTRCCHVRFAWLSHVNPDPVPKTPGIHSVAVAVCTQQVRTE